MLIKLDLVKELVKNHNKRIEELMDEYKDDDSFISYLKRELITESNFCDFLKPMNHFDGHIDTEDGFYIQGLNGFDSYIEDLTEYKIIKEFDSFTGIKDNMTVEEKLKCIGKDDYRNNYGVCDNSHQVLKRYPELLADLDRIFVVKMTPIFKDEQPEYGGWRWHKWGQYIGDKNPQCEYIYDEEDIDMVFCYHIYEIKSK